MTPAEPGGLDEIIVLEVPDSEAGARLDVFLSERIRDCSRTYIKRLIDEGAVTIGDSATKPSHAVRPGETVIVTLPEEEPEDLEPFPEEIGLNVIYEDADVAVVDKPAGMPVHASRGHSQGTLVNALLGRGCTLSTVGEAVRPGIVHRLDMDTSGCIVCAKTDEAHRELQRQWKAREVVKEYLAVVHGNPRFEEGVIDRPLARDSRKRKRMAVRSGGKESRTHFRVEESFEGFSLVRASPKTGRTHQIRVHMANMGNPVLCDGLYGLETQVSAGELRGGEPDGEILLRRQALHSELLAFAHPVSGTWMDFRAPLHSDMMSVLALLVSRRGSDLLRPGGD